MGEIIRHKKTGGLYEVLFRDVAVNCVHALGNNDKIQIVRNPDEKTVEIWPASWQTEYWEVLAKGCMQTGIPLKSGDKAVVYHVLANARVWARRASEMDDGRFEPAVAHEAPSSTPGEVERLVDALIEAARAYGWSMDQGSALDDARDAKLEAAARTALLSHISTAGRGEGSPDDQTARMISESDALEREEAEAQRIFRADPGAPLLEWDQLWPEIKSKYRHLAKNQLAISDDAESWAAFANSSQGEQHR